MRYRKVALLIVLWAMFDLTNPFVGCVFNFEVAESMDVAARQPDRLRGQTVTMALSMPARGGDTTLARPLCSRRPGSRALDEWFVQVRQAHAPHSDPQSPTEDH